MKMYIPTIGTSIILTQDWKFTLNDEHRNKTLYTLMGGTPYNPWDSKSGTWRSDNKITAILPEKTVLTIDRIYIRKGGSAYSSFDSISFVVKHTPLAKKGRLRFWAKLDDVNNIEFEVYKP